MALDKVLWSRDMEIFLIERVKDNCILWDIRNESYAKGNLKKAGFDAVARCVMEQFPGKGHISGEHVQVKFRYFKNYFQRELRRRKENPCGSGQTECLKWDLFESLRFLPEDPLIVVKTEPSVEVIDLDAEEVIVDPGHSTVVNNASIDIISDSSSSSTDEESHNFYKDPTKEIAIAKYSNSKNPFSILTPTLKRKRKLFEPETLQVAVEHRTSKVRSNNDIYTHAGQLYTEMLQQMRLKDSLEVIAVTQQLCSAKIMKKLCSD